MADDRARYEKTGHINAGGAGTDLAGGYAASDNQIPPKQSKHPKRRDHYEET